MYGTTVGNGRNMKGRYPLMKTTMSRKFTKVMAAALTAAAITISAGATSVSADTSYTAYDTQFLNDMGVCPDRWGDFYTTFNWTEVSTASDKAWGEVGVRCVSKYMDENQYFINDSIVSRKEAYNHVSYRLGKDYDYKKYQGLTMY